MQTCNTCGFVEKDDSSLFCQNCGNSLRETNNQMNQPRVSFINQRTIKKSVTNGKTVVIVFGVAFLLIALVIGGLFVGLYNNSFTYTKIGERTYSEPLDSVKEISFDFTNSLGNYFIKSGIGLNDAFSINQAVSSTNGNAQLGDSTEVIVNNVNGSVSITFDANQNSFSSQNFKYDFVISVNIEVPIKNINLFTQTGSIDSMFQNQTIYSFKEVSNTGTVTTSFIDCSFMDGLTGVSTSTGYIQFDLESPSFYSNRTWDIGTSTGSITSNIKISNMSNYEQKFDIHASTGSVNLNRSYKNNPFETITARVSTGSISFNNIDQVGKTFSNNNGNTNSPLILHFNLETSTGDIHIN